MSGTAHTLGSAGGGREFRIQGSGFGGWDSMVRVEGVRESHRFCITHRLLENGRLDPATGAALLRRHAG